MGDREFFWLGDSIQSEFIKTLIPAISAAHQEDPENEITLWISSGGGSFISAITFLDFIRAKNINLTTIGISDVCSSAVLVWSCGRIRKATRHCRFFFHRPQWDVGREGTGIIFLSGEECRVIKKDLKKINRRLCRLLAKQLGINIESLKRLNREETWLTAQDAEKMGLLHQII